MDDYNTIHKIPLLPPAIKEAVKNKELVIFIGAGVSQIIGCASWTKLADNLIERCLKTKKTDGQTCINYKGAEIISNINDNKKIITICHKILRDSSFEDIFKTEFNESLIAKPELLEKPNIYDELSGLHGVFITTNADDHFHNKFIPTHIFYKVDDFDPSGIETSVDKLYHIHGFKDDYDSLVFTVPQYIERYSNQIFGRFLKQIFKNHTVLFIGYGLAEFELLDFLISKFDASNDAVEQKRFMLQAYFKGDEETLKFDQFYYNSMGITVIGYEKDEKGYNQIYEVIKNWNTEIRQTSTYLLDSFQEIEEIVGDL